MCHNKVPGRTLDRSQGDVFLGCLTLLGHCVFKKLCKQMVINRKTKAQRTTEDLVSNHSVREKSYEDKTLK